MSSVRRVASLFGVALPGFEPCVAGGAEGDEVRGVVGAALSRWDDGRRSRRPPLAPNKRQTGSAMTRLREFVRALVSACRLALKDSKVVAMGRLSA